MVLVKTEKLMNVTSSDLGRLCRKSVGIFRDGLGKHTTYFSGGMANGIYQALANESSKTQGKENLVISSIICFKVWQINN